jgi:hypothetical protein
MTSLEGQYVLAIFGILALVALLILFIFYELDDWPGKNSKNFYQKLVDKI